MIETTLERLERVPGRLVLDRAYDREKFRDRFAARGIDPVVPYRERAVNKKYADPDKPLAYRRRWLVERTFAWMGNFRRVLTRHERVGVVYQAFAHLACVIITLRHL